MAISDTEYTAWLKQQSARRCVLVETSYGVASGGLLVDDTGDYLIDDTGARFKYSNGTAEGDDIFISNIGYVTLPSEIPADQVYLPALKGGISITGELELNAKAALYVGDLEIDNSNGQYDHWLDFIWTNRAITVYFGDVFWDRADFRLVFSGVIGGIDSKNQNTLNIKVLDKLQRLNMPLTTTTLGGDSVNQDKLKPLLFGECFNITPLLVDPALLKYQWHNGVSERAIEIRDNGVPVSATHDLLTGSFTLATNPFGTITASGQGDNVGGYSNTVAGVVQNIATNYGEATKRFALAEIDTVNFSAFETSNPQPVGLYSPARLNIITAINQLASSVGAQAVMSREGKLRLLKIEFPPTGTPVEIAPVDMQEKSLKIAKRVPVKASIKIAYCKNWTVQKDLPTGIPEEHKALFADEWVDKIAVDTGVASDYALEVDPPLKETLLLDDVDASNEAARLLSVYKNQRTVYEFTGYANLIEMQLGDAVTLRHNRFGLSAGKLGVVVKVQIDWSKMQVKLGVMI